MKLTTDCSRGRNTLDESSFSGRKKVNIQFSHSHGKLMEREVSSYMYSRESDIILCTHKNVEYAYSDEMMMRHHWILHEQYDRNEGCQTGTNSDEQVIIMVKKCIYYVICSTSKFQLYCIITHIVKYYKHHFAKLKGRTNEKASSYLWFHKTEKGRMIYEGICSFNPRQPGTDSWKLTSPYWLYV